MSTPSDTPAPPRPGPADAAARRRRRARRLAEAQTPSYEAQTPSYAAPLQPGVMRPPGPGLRHAPRAIAALVIREMSTTYGRSPLGYLWAILEPVAGIMLLTLIFSIGFRSPPIGTSFALFYASGVLPFSIYTGLSGKIAQALRFSKALLFYPRVTFLDAIIGRLLLNTLTHAMVTIVLFTLIIQVYKLDPILDVPAMVLSFVMTVCLAAGVGLVNCYLFTTFPTWQLVWGVVNRPLLFLSGVLFVFDTIPEPFRGWLWWNPLIHVIGQMRKGVYPTYDGAYVSLTYVFGVSGVLAVIGLMLLRRYHRDIVNT